MASEHEMRDKDQRLNLANFPIRTDLAREAVDMAVQNRGDGSGIPGVQMDEHEEEGITTSWIRIEDEQGAEALGKVPGLYLTLEIPALREQGFRIAEPGSLPFFRSI